MKKRLKYLIVLLLCWVCLHLAYVCYDGLHDYKGNADIAIVLGITVYADSSLSAPLKSRVDKAYKLYMEGRVKKIMVSGGKGEFKVREGMAMKRYLLSRNVPADRIIEDNNGANTYLTARDFLALNDSLHFSSAIAVTSFYHITRTKYIIRKLGFKNIHGASADTFFPSDVFGLLRDYLAFYKYVFVY